jgi:hypothetical protein
MCVVAAPKLDQIGEQQPEKKAQDGAGGTFRDQRHTAFAAIPAHAGDAGDLADQPDELAALEIVGRARQQDGSREWCVVKMAADLGDLVENECLADAALDGAGKMVGCAERSEPQSGKTDRHEEPDRTCGVAAARAPERDRSGDDADDQPGADDRPEIGPQRAHALSRASSRQPMSRRWKPSAKSIWSTAR